MAIDALNDPALQEELVRHLFKYLGTKDATRWNKALEDLINHEGGIDAILARIAEGQQPQPKLRGSEGWEMYNTPMFQTRKYKQDKIKSDAAKAAGNMVEAAQALANPGAYLAKRIALDVVAPVVTNGIRAGGDYLSVGNSILGDAMQAMGANAERRAPLTGGSTADHLNNKGLGYQRRAARQKIVANTAANIIDQVANNIAGRETQARNEALMMNESPSSDYWRYRNGQESRQMQQQKTRGQQQ